jgi:hypothetical protein
MISPMAYLALALQAIKLKFIDGRFLTIFYFVRRSDQGSAGLDPAPHDKNDWCPLGRAGNGLIC